MPVRVPVTALFAAASLASPSVSGSQAPADSALAAAPVVALLEKHVAAHRGYHAVQGRYLTEGWRWSPRTRRLW